MRLYSFISLLGSFVFIHCISWAGSFVEQSPEELTTLTDGILVGKIQSAEGYRAEDGSIRTRFVVLPENQLQGQFPAAVWISIPGGIYQKTGEYQSSHVHLKLWDRALLLLEENEYGLALIEGAYGAVELSDSDDPQSLKGQFLSEIETLAISLNNRDFSDYVPTSSFDQAVSSNGLSGFDDNGPRRFQRQDRLDPIPVYYDTSLLPNGMTPQQAVTALQNALAAWESATSLKFDIIGDQTFPETVRSFNDGGDEVLRIQFHDKFDDIGGSTLGIGGSSFFFDVGAGGTVNGIEFVEVVRGYVVLAHDSSTLENPVDFEEVLTHEIGHAIGLSHSSESQFEPDPDLKEAIMYYRAAANGRGAQLQNYDITTVRRAYPIDNVPPFAISQNVAILTTPGTFSDSRINTFEIGGGDRDGDNLTVEVIDNPYVTYFEVSGTTVRYIRPGWFSDNDASENGFFSRFEYRLSDGVHKSGYGSITVKQTRSDQAADGVADSWADFYFGTRDTSNNRGAFDDFDNDGIVNYYEFRAGTDPTQAESSFEFIAVDYNDLSFSGNDGDLFLLETSTNLTDWSLSSYTKIAPNENSAKFDPSLIGDSALFYRVRRLD